VATLRKAAQSAAASAARDAALVIGTPAVANEGNFSGDAGCSEKSGNAGQATEAWVSCAK
jgi:hypothetical protein